MWLFLWVVPRFRFQVTGLFEEHHILGLDNYWTNQAGKCWVDLQGYIWHDFALLTLKVIKEVWQKPSRHEGCSYKEITGTRQRVSHQEREWGQKWTSDILLGHLESEPSSYVWILLPIHEAEISTHCSSWKWQILSQWPLQQGGSQMT